MLNETILTLFAEEIESIPYRKSIAEVTGSITSAILLQQMCFNWHRKGKDSFYKFKAPCDNAWYKPEDSWTEELGFTIGEFNGARKKIATKAKSKEEIDELLKIKKTTHCVIYYKDSANVTWWYCNPKAIARVLNKAVKLSRERNLRIEEAKGEVLEDPRTKAKNFDNKGVISRSDKLSPPLPPENTHKNIIMSNEENKVSEEEKAYESKILEAIEPKKVEPKKPRQQKMDRAFKKGLKMPIDFDIPSDVLLTAIEMGYENRDVYDEKIKYIHYYTVGNGKTQISEDWEHNFVYGWLDRGYKKGYLKRNGEFYRTNAGDDRLTKLREHSKPLFTDFTE